MNDVYTLRQPWLRSIQLLLNDQNKSSASQDNMSTLLQIACESVDSLEVADVLDVIASYIDHSSVDVIDEESALAKSGGALLLCSILHRHADYVHVQVACINAIAACLRKYKRFITSSNQSNLNEKEVQSVKQMIQAAFHQLQQILSEQMLYDASYHACIRLALA